MAVKKSVNSKPLTTTEMEVAIANYFDFRKYIIVPNISWGFKMHECDLFMIKKSGCAVEVEIKRSKSDFLADFNKVHHHHDDENRIVEFYYAFPKSLYEKVKDLVPKGAGVITCHRYIDYKGRERLGAHTEVYPERIKGARKLTTEEQLKIARLGTMRIWSLKEKIIKSKNS